jgi:hypothetical protein
METADHRGRFVKSFRKPLADGQKRSRHPRRRSLSAVALGALLAAGGLSAASSPAKAGGIASVDMQAACHAQYPTAWGASFWNTGPYGWYCYNYNSWSPWPNDLGGIDVNRACHDQYPGWNLHAVLVANNIFGWRCES